MKGLLVTGAITILILIGGIFLLSGNDASQTPKIVDQNILIKENSHQTSPGASVTIVEFGDYRCPACKASFPEMKKIVDEYKEKVNFVFRHFAFLPDSVTNQSPNASTLAANAAECAADQGKFWEMHDWLYENQPDESKIEMYNIDNLTKNAVTLGMDEAKFKKCLQDKTFDNVVKADYADGQLAGVSGTPSFYINGKYLPGVPMYEDLKSAIESILNK